MEYLEEIVKAILTVVLAVFGSALTFNIKFAKEFKTKKRAEFLEKQLSEFYGPMKILHREIRTLSDMRVHDLSVFREHADPEHTKHDQQHADLIAKHNIEIQTIIIPIYEQMKSLLLAKVHLAEPEVIEGYDKFYLFLRRWLDHLEKPIGSRFPSEAAIKLVDESKEPVDYFKLVEQQFEEKRIEYTNLIK